MRTQTMAIIVFLVVSVGILIAMYANDDPDKRAVESQGFTNVKIGDWAPLSCGEEDMTAKHFTATNPQGKSVAGVVCCGIFKSCTIRW